MTATTSNDPPEAGPGERDLWRGWFAAAEDNIAGTDLRKLFDDLDQRVRARGPTCWTSGRCCKFDAFGHLLYVTGLEIAWVVQRGKRFESQVPLVEIKPPPKRLPVLSGSNSKPAFLDPKLPAACTYQIDGLCSIHAIRPMGCRVFFCQEGTAQWQNELYEEFLGQLRSLHDRLAIPYRYMEWRGGLEEAKQHRPSTSSPT